MDIGDFFEVQTMENLFYYIHFVLDSPQFVHSQNGFVIFDTKGCHPGAIQVKLVSSMTHKMCHTIIA